MNVAVVEVDKEPSTKEEWEAIVAKAKAQVLDKLKAEGASPEQLEAAERELEKAVRAVPAEGEEMYAFSMRATVDILAKVMELIDDLPRAFIGFGKHFANKGEHAHNFMMGIAQSEVVTALACLGHAKQALERATGCECKEEKKEDAQ